MIATPTGSTRVGSTDLTLKGFGIVYQLKAEVVFATLVSLRHRAAVLAALLTAVVVGMLYWTGAGLETAVPVLAMSLGVLTGAVASRPFAGDGSRQSAWSTPGRRLVTSTGRLVGSLLLVFPVAMTALAVVSVAETPARFIEVAAALGVQLAGIAALTQLASCLLGASAAAGTTFFLSLFGGIPPEGLAQLFGSGPLAAVATRSWAALPLNWRLGPVPMEGLLLASAAWTVVCTFGVPRILRLYD